MTDDTIPGLAGTVREVQDRIREEFKATEVDVNARPDETVLRLTFRGFTSLADALSRTGEVVRELNERDAVTSISSGVNSSGQYDPDLDDQTDRPSGWVTATLSDEGGDAEEPLPKADETSDGS